MTNITLPNVTLAAIVRDERMNPAGGIEDFIHCHMPFVGTGVIVDTESLDGTRDILERMRKQYQHMQIHDHDFKGFADARNYSLDQVKTPHVLVLDADERLSQSDFEGIRILLEECPNIFGLNFAFEHIKSDNEHLFKGHLNPRLFIINTGLKYQSLDHCYAEFLSHGWLFWKKVNAAERSTDTSISIKHFLSPSEGRKIKENVWYKAVQGAIDRFPAPSQTEGFPEWKTLNPKRLEYHFGLPDYQFKMPEGVISNRA